MKYDNNSLEKFNEKTGINISTKINLSNIDIYAQPVVDISNKFKERITFEILSRFHDGNEDLIYPESIFSQPQNINTLFFLDKEIFSKTFHQLDKYRSILGRDFNIAINVTEETMLRTGCFFNYFDELMEKYNFKPRNINLEVTERKSYNLDFFVEKALSKGYNLSIDDFGTEDFTQGKLRNLILPLFDKNTLDRLYLKIDKSVVSNINKPNNFEREIDLSYLDFIYSIKKTYPKINLVAEGVEDKKTLDLLLSKAEKKEVKLDFVQGYYFARPKLFDSTYRQPNYNNFI